MILMVILAGCGAAIGALCRFVLMQVTQPLNSRWQLPVTTLFINLTGALLLGWILTAPLTIHQQIFLGTGIMGGYTTFSTMINEVVLLGRNHRHHVARLYLALSLVGGLAMVFLGTLI